MPDIVEIGLPPKPEYLPVLRAATGVIAGNLSFNYDEIVQLRVAVSEAFGLAVGDLSKEGDSAAELTVRISILPDRIEITVPRRSSTAPSASSPEEQESWALLTSLMDEVEVRDEPPGGKVIRMIKNKTSNAG